jgi:uncharacterized protein (TIGR03118 family)
MRQLLLSLLVIALAAGARAATPFTQTNLVTNDPLAHPAQITDSNLVNPWGISMTATSPFWVSDNGTGVSTLYQVDPVTQATSKVGLTVTIPDAGTVTGQVSNPNAAGGAFNGDNFLFVSEDGSISGWRGALGTNAERLQLPEVNNIYKGAAIGVIAGNTYLLAANFHTGKIDVLKGSASAPDLAGKFTDPGLPAGFAPFNVQNLGGKIYVAYAKIDPNNSTDEMAGAGLGFVTAFDTNGNFLGRVVSQGALNAPWGLAIAPASFGEFAGDLLVGNFGDGRINAYDLTTNSLVGPLLGADNLPLAIDGLWALTPGNNGSGGSSSALYFSAGPDDESNGLFGVITPAVPEPGCAMILACAAMVLSRPRRT